MVWISATEKLPLESGKYLITDGKTITIAFWSDKNGWEIERNDRLLGFYESAVTHWLPLPELPKQE